MSQRTRLAPLAQVGGLAGEGVGAAVEGARRAAAASSRLAASTAFSQAALTQTGEPSAAAIQAGLGARVQEGGEARRGRQARVLAQHRREPQPGQGAGRAALDRDHAAPGP